MDKLVNVTIDEHSSRRPPNPPVLKAAEAAGVADPQPLLPRRHPRGRQLPRLRRQGRRPAAASSPPAAPSSAKAWSVTDRHQGSLRRRSQAISSCSPPTTSSNAGTARARTTCEFLDLLRRFSVDNSYSRRADLQAQGSAS
ncbi:MAG: hypothetical protein MZU97_14435 [Bacillus subtilis]|nr:hypothetical protein [Bacillus subtilis]